MWFSVELLSLNIEGHSVCRRKIPCIINVMGNPFDTHTSQATDVVCLFVRGCWSDFCFLHGGIFFCIFFSFSVFVHRDRKSIARSSPYFDINELNADSQTIISINICFVSHQTEIVQSGK